MAITLAKLSAKTVALAAVPGRYGDGGGLYLVVDKGGAKRWVFLFRWREAGHGGTGRLREMGLGPLRSVSLARAREKAAAARAQVADRIDPIAQRRGAAPKPMFGDLADTYVATKKAELRNEKSIARVERALTRYASSLRNLRVDEISTQNVVDALRPIWTSKQETAKNVRVYIEGVLNAAKAQGFRQGDNPARWKDHLDHILPKQQKLTRGHHRALPYKLLPTFMGELSVQVSMGARALEFLILTAGRSGEVLGARWDEIDMEAAVWTIPALRMKAGKEHRVPLSPRALALLSPLKEGRLNDFVFPGLKADRPLSSMAMEMLLRRIGAHEQATVHGFRSAFRDWAGDETRFPREIAEGALAHAVGDATEQAYRRGDALTQRRRLIEQWADYLFPTAATVHSPTASRSSALDELPEFDQSEVDSRT